MAGKNPKPMKHCLKMVIEGNPHFIFMRADRVEAAWKVIIADLRNMADEATR
jgi:hypothetical protein